ncbi:MAG TPA: sulfotransferase domain-containing protein [Holophagaceae bacterium]|jgi:hypothetical protein|nr:sulfotransferase domain-containing protein [Holophagaceae bacterium]
MAFQPFFVAGAPKSGTTWLGKLLDAHPEISCKGEACVHYFTKALIQISNDYNALLERRKATVSDSNAFPPVLESEVHALMRHFIDLRLAVIADPAKPRLRFVGEKDPIHGPNFPMLQKLFPEARYMHIIRDGRGVLVSAWHHNQRATQGGQRAPGFDAFLDDMAERWSQMVRISRNAAAKLGEACLEIRYEELSEDPQTGFKRVLNHLGADAGEATVRACVEAASFEKLSKGRAKGQEDAQSFFRKGVADDWKNHMTPAQIQRFNARSGGLLEELGYLG